MNNYLSEKIKRLSFIAIIMVVFLHSSNSIVWLNTGAGSRVTKGGFSQFVQDFISAGITNVAVPIFFLFSGFLFFLNLDGTLTAFTGKFRKRIKSLLIPFLLWSLWAIILCYFLQTLPQSKPFFTKAIISEYSIPELIEIWLVRPIAYQLWFIQHLVVIIAFSPLIFWLVKRFNYFFLFPLIIAWIYNYNFYSFSIEGVLFFSVGALLAIKKPDGLIRDLAKYRLVLLISWVAIVLLKTYLIFISSPNVFLIVVLGKCGILIGLVSMWSLYDNFHLNNNIQSVSFSRMAGFSFFLFASHEPILTMVKKLLIVYVQPGDFSSLLIYFLTALFTIAVCLTSGLFLKRFTPAFYGLITGGR